MKNRNPMMKTTQRKKLMIHFMVIVSTANTNMANTTATQVTVEEATEAEEDPTTQVIILIPVARARHRDRRSHAQ